MTIETHFLRGNGRIPNSHLPLLVYRSVLKGTAAESEELLRSNQWPPDWHTSYGLYPKHHFHSDTHELVAVTRGSLVARFGGHDGILATLHAGDLVVLPAGVGHYGESITEDLRLTGAFPAGYAIHDFRLGYPEEYARMVERVQKVPVPAYDPVYGAGGPLTQLWTARPGGHA